MPPSESPAAAMRCGSMQSARSGRPSWLLFSKLSMMKLTSPGWLRMSTKRGPPDVPRRVRGKSAADHITLAGQIVCEICTVVAHGHEAVAVDHQWCRAGQRGRFGQDSGVIRLQGGGSDCPRGMSFWGKDVNASYTSLIMRSAIFPGPGVSVAVHPSSVHDWQHCWQSITDLTV